MKCAAVSVAPLPKQGTDAALAEDQADLSLEAGEVTLSKACDSNEALQEFCIDNSPISKQSSSGYQDTPIFIEACAGCGILSSVVQQRGLQVIPIDCPRNRHVPRCRIVVMDLTSTHADELLRRIVNYYTIAGVHVALPCGTCSRARGIPLADGSAGPRCPTFAWAT